MTHEICSQEPELTEDAVDSELLRQAIAEAKGEFVTVDELLEEWGLKLKFLMHRGDES